jgi:hypothetical protein
MNFYKTVCIVALVILIISLAFIGSALASSSKNTAFPPNISKCPDNSEIDYEYGEFVSCKTQSQNSDSSCQVNSFSDASYNMPGIGSTSGACEKKRWAKKCGVDWDGLTNNNIICHSTNI